MQPPPPLALRCPASRAWREACGVVSAAAGAAFAAWLARQGEWPPLAMAAAALAAALAFGALGRRLPGGHAGSAAAIEMAWDGERWHVDGAPGRIELMLDLGHRLMLLRMRPDSGKRGGRARWLAIEAPGVISHPAGEGGAAWRALRTAIYSPPPAATRTEPSVRVADRVAD